MTELSESLYSVPRAFSAQQPGVIVSEHLEQQLDQATGLSGDHVSADQQPGQTAETVPAAQGEAAEPEAIDIVINNVVCSYATRCHLNLKKIALEGMHVVFRKENGMVSMKLRHPRVTASIWSSGKITCTGATSEEESRIGARRVTRILQKMGFRVRFCNFNVVNVLGTCIFPFGIRITHFSRDHKQNAEYEPELHPGVTYRIKMPKATLKIFSTGSVTVTAPCVANVQTAIEHIYPLVLPYQMEARPKDRKKEEVLHLMPSRRGLAPKRSRRQKVEMTYSSDEDDMSDSEDDEEDFDSEDSED